MSNKNNRWYEDNKFWKSVKPVLFTDNKWKEASKDVDNIISLIDIKAEYRILDLCCGTGRHSLELANRGFSVTGVDRTSLYIKEAKKKAKEMNLDVEFIEEDMRDFIKPESFDVILNLWASFGYFEKIDDDRKVLLNVYRSLKDSGRFIMEVISKEILARVFRKRDWREEDGIFILEEREITDNWNKLKNRWVVVDKKKRTEYNFSLRIYSGKELSSMLEGCGFSNVKLYGNLEGNPYNDMGEKLIAVAYK